MNIVILGPPGSGKGTQSRLIAARGNLIQVSMGERLREATASDQLVAPGARAKMENGSLVPDSIIVRLLELAIQKKRSCRGFVFDGVPRTGRQALLLEQILERRKLGLDLALELIVDQAELGRRLKSRQRSDDLPDIIESRLTVYEREIKSLRAFYCERGIYSSVEASRPIEVISREINQLIMQVLAGLRGRNRVREQLF